jgi:hypothetical protein
MTTNSDKRKNKQDLIVSCRSCVDCSEHHEICTLTVVVQCLSAAVVDHCSMPMIKIAIATAVTMTINKTNGKDTTAAL